MNKSKKILIPILITGVVVLGLYCIKNFKVWMQDYLYGEETFIKSDGETIESLVKNDSGTIQFSFYKPKNINYTNVNSSNQVYELTPVVERSDAHYCGYRYIWAKIILREYSEFNTDDSPLYLSTRQSTKVETNTSGKNNFDTYSFKGRPSIYVTKQNGYYIIVELNSDDCGTEVFLPTEFEQLLSSLKIETVE